VKGTEIKSKNL